MRLFQRLAVGVDVLPLLHAIGRQPQLWNANTLRTKHPQSPHKAVDDIWLRFNELKPDLAEVVNDLDCVNYPAFAALPQARSMLFDLMRRVEGERLGRVLVTRLAPGQKIEPHADLGAPATYYDRYHITLQNSPGSIFRCGDEQAFMAIGEVWWFDNTKVHEVVNNSGDDRITMIVDIRQC